MGTEPEPPSRKRSQSAGASAGGSGSRSHPLITPLDCTFGIRRRRGEIFVLVVFSMLMEILVLFAIEIELVSSIASEPALTRAATVALSTPVLLPLKLAFDRYSELSLLRSVRETLERGFELSTFMVAELTKLTAKKGSIAELGKATAKRTRTTI
jgi:hypothetical protein